MTNEGGCSEPAATPSNPPNRSWRIRVSSQIWTAIPASEATVRTCSASRAGVFSDGGVLARSRARLIAWPMISPRRTCLFNLLGGFFGRTRTDDHIQCFKRVPVGFGLPQARSPGPGDNPGNERRDPTAGRARDGLGNRQRHAPARLRRQPLGECKARRVRRTGIELTAGTEPHNEHRASGESGKPMNHGQFVRRAAEVFLLDQPFQQFGTGEYPESPRPSPPALPREKRRAREIESRQEAGDERG